MRIVVKIGTSTLTHSTGNLNIRRFEELCKVMADLKNAGHEIILVSSGAIAMGVGKLGLMTRPSDMPGKQAAAAVGQCELMYFYDRMFSAYNQTVAQLLLTGEDFKNDDRHNNFRNAMARLLDMGVLPIINENDTVSTEEIGVGDNDSLGAYVAESVKADILVLLSDCDGLFTAEPTENPDAKLIDTVTAITDEIREIAGGKGSAFGTGGMKTKIHAAEICFGCGCDMVIANGQNPEILYGIVDGQKIGTRFTAPKR